MSTPSVPPAQPSPPANKTPTANDPNAGRSAPIPPAPDTTGAAESGAVRLTSIPTVEVRDRKRNDADFLLLDESSLDPNRHYRWVRLDENSTAVARRRRQGYRVERRHKQGGPKTLAEPDSRADDAIVIGDLILMSCPKAVAEQRREDTRRRTEQLKASTTAETERAAKEKGIQVIKDPDHGSIRQEILG